MRTKIMHALIELFRTANQTQIEINGEWVPARPYCGSFWWRLSDAWKVLKGEADAIMWPGGQ